MKEDRGRKIRCIIAGGGTGGHLFPGIAIARELGARSKNASVLFVVGRKRMESEILQKHGFQVTFIQVEGLKGRGLKKGITVFAMLPKSLFQSMAIIRDFKPSIVVGVGGYSAGPFCLAARILGVPTAIHEQNSYPGLTNRLLAPVVDRILISFPESGPFFKNRKTILTGNPIRRELLSPPENAPSLKKHFTILVVGGSQGASAINSAFVKTCGILKDSARDFDFIHQTGKQDHERVLEKYRATGFESSALETRVMPFIEDMTAAYHRADMVVSRAGATTLFELAALGKPSVLIPYPYATNGHQETNARSLVRLGGAEMVMQESLCGEKLADIISTCMDHPQKLEKMGKAAKIFARPDADRIIVDHLMGLLKTNDPKPYRSETS